MTDIFDISDEKKFNTAALELYRLHSEKNPVYREYIALMGVFGNEVEHYSQIPFLPIDFFRTRKVLLDDVEDIDFFESSGTTGSTDTTGGEETTGGAGTTGGKRMTNSERTTSRHYIADFSLYEKSLLQAFTHFIGAPSEYAIVVLLPHYLEREHSSLVYMVKTLMQASGNKHNGFFLYNHEELYKTLLELENIGQKTLLMGVSFALLDFADKYKLSLKHTLVMETGGMKGRKKEITRSELHATLRSAFGVKHIYSEYGMAELFSQAYLLQGNKFRCPPWMKILLRSTYDPLEIISEFGKTGGINVIDLANAHSCPFIQTQDLGKLHPDGSFEVLGRFDHSQIRGCNLMV
ncbi:MAG: acyltransferase [Bacteroidales bacterium]|jgi:hypothetical protein|nr:acyltransferase [Bacteroidales bacterium]